MSSERGSIVVDLLSAFAAKTEAPMPWYSFLTSLFHRSSPNETGYRYMVETIPQIVWAARADGWIDYDNPRWYDYTGLDPARGAGWGWESVIHPDDLPEVDRRWKQAIESGMGYSIEYRL